MKFSVPCNWQDGLLDLLDEYKIEELYGTLADDFLGGGRPSFMLPKISRRYFKRYIQEVRKRGVKFNYLLNTTCAGNQELTAAGERTLRHLLDWIVSTGVEAVTVSLPYLLEFIKHNYLHLKVFVSTMAGVDSLERARYWQALGADRITLSAVSGVSRDFKLLRLMRSNMQCELQLIANLTCLYECPLWPYHAAIYSHASQVSHCSRGFFIDYCFLRCNYMKLKDPSEFIRSPWIRPEDVMHYEKIGIDGIKFANRTMSTSAIKKLISAYHQRRYEGNLLELFSDTSKQNCLKKHSGYLLNKAKYLFRPFSVNILKLSKLRNLLGEPGVYIDNRALDGFLEYFLQSNCVSGGCQECGYCYAVSRKAIRINESKREEMLLLYDRFLNGLSSGEVFRYLQKKEKS